MSQETPDHEDMMAEAVRLLSAPDNDKAVMFLAPAVAAMLKIWPAEAVAAALDELAARTRAGRAAELLKPTG
jgi:hypothetical protein